MPVLSSLNLPTASSFKGVQNNATLPGLNTLPALFGTLNTVSKAKDALTNLPSIGEVAEATKDKIPSLDQVSEKLKSGLPPLSTFTEPSLENIGQGLSKIASSTNALSGTGGLFSAFKGLLNNSNGLSGKGYTAAPGSMWDTPSGQPESPGYASYYPPYARVYFSLDRSALPALKARGFSEQIATSLIEEGFWEYIMQTYSEAHSEGYALKNTQSDTYTVYATGANPVQVSMSGHLYTTPTSDHRIDFLEMYNTLLRGTRLADLNMVLTFHMKDTVMKLNITDISIGNASSVSDMTSLSINGVGYKYQVRGIDWTKMRQVTKAVASSSKQNAKTLKTSADAAAVTEAETLKAEATMVAQNQEEMANIDTTLADGSAAPVTLLPTAAEKAKDLAESQAELATIS